MNETLKPRIEVKGHASDEYCFLLVDEKQKAIGAYDDLAELKAMLENTRPPAQEHISKDVDESLHRSLKESLTFKDEPAQEAVGYVLFGSDREPLAFHSEEQDGYEAIYTTPPDDEARRLLNTLYENGDDLRSEQSDDDYHYCVYEHHQGKPDKLIGIGPTALDALREAYLAQTDGEGE